MHENDYQLFRGYVLDSVRRSLGDARLRNLLPEKLEQEFDKTPDTIISSVADVLLPGVLRAQGMPVSESENQRLHGAAQLALQSSLTASALRALAKMRALRMGEKDYMQDGALLFCARGRKFLASERYREAQQAFRRATEIKPDIKFAWIGLAEAYEKLEQPQLAAQAREQAGKL